MQAEFKEVHNKVQVATKYRTRIAQTTRQTIFERSGLLAMQCAAHSRHLQISGSMLQLLQEMQTHCQGMHQEAEEYETSAHESQHLSITAPAADRCATIVMRRPSLATSTLYELNTATNTTNVLNFTVDV